MNSLGAYSYLTERRVRNKHVKLSTSASKFRSQKRLSVAFEIEEDDYLSPDISENAQDEMFLSSDKYVESLASEVEEGAVGGVSREEQCRINKCKAWLQHAIFEEHRCKHEYTFHCNLDCSPCNCMPGSSSAKKQLKIPKFLLKEENETSASSANSSRTRFTPKRKAERITSTPIEEKIRNFTPQVCPYELLLLDVMQDIHRKVEESENLMRRELSEVKKMLKEIMERENNNNLQNSQAEGSVREEYTYLKAHEKILDLSSNSGSKFKNLRM